MKVSVLQMIDTAMYIVIIGGSEHTWLQNTVDDKTYLARFLIYEQSSVTCSLNFSCQFLFILDPTSRENSWVHA